MKNKKIPFLVYAFFILIYANQGMMGLPSQAIYYLTRETWLLSATQLGLISFIIGLAWYIKPIFGIITDTIPINKYRTKYYLYINYIFIVLAIFYVLIFDFNLLSLIIISTLINFAIAFNDVCNDTQMVKLEQKHNLQGKLQAIQWISLGSAGLFVSIVGAWVAQAFPEPLNYKIAYGFLLILPILTLWYLFKYYKERPVKTRKKLSDLKFDLKYFKNKEFILGIAFIAFLRFSPSFGNALMIKMREELMIGKMFLGYLSATGTILGLIGYALYYWKAHKFPIKKLLYFTIVFSAMTNLCYLYLPNKWVVLFYTLLFGAFDGICFLTVLAYIAKIIPRGAEGMFYALVTSVNNLAGRLGGLTGGVIYDNLGYNSNVIIASATTLVCLLFIPHLFKKKG